MAKSGRI